MAALDDVIQCARVLERRIDEVVEAAERPEIQQRADWAWFRFRSVLDFTVQGGAGPVAASLARGLLEEAAYWDWALTVGIGAGHLVRRAALEYAGLQRVARDVDDDQWLGWILPPGVVLSASSSDGIPRNAQDAVTRIGSGLATPVLEPLRFRGLFAANHLLSVLTHGNMAAALVMAPGGGDGLPEALAAAVVHVAAAGTTAVVTACLEIPNDTVQILCELAIDVADAASLLHELPRLETAVARQPARVRDGAQLLVSSEIERMPTASAVPTTTAIDFAASAVALAHTAIHQRRAPDEPGVSLAWVSFQLSWGQMELLRGVLDGTVARAILPFAARALLEEGARWEWIRKRSIAQPGSGSFRAVLSESKQYIHRVRESMVSEGIRPGTVDRLLGHAAGLSGPDADACEVPPIGDLLELAYPNASGVDSARAMYSVLTQFVHATPLALLHLRPDQLTSVTAPVYAIAIEAACRGFFNIVNTTLRIACETDEALEGQLSAVAATLDEVRFEAAPFHVLG